jgi:hypothetical protein
MPWEGMLWVAADAILMVLMCELGDGSSIEMCEGKGRESGIDGEDEVVRTVGL